jgi:hypothetical protein
MYSIRQADFVSHEIWRASQRTSASSAVYTAALPTVSGKAILILAALATIFAIWFMLVEMAQNRKKKIRRQPNDVWD